MGAARSLVLVVGQSEVVVDLLVVDVIRVACLDEALAVPLLLRRHTWGLVLLLRALAVTGAIRVLQELLVLADGLLHQLQVQGVLARVGQVRLLDRVEVELVRMSMSLCALMQVLLSGAFLAVALLDQVVQVVQLGLLARLHRQLLCFRRR